MMLRIFMIAFLGLAGGAAQAQSEGGGLNITLPDLIVVGKPEPEELAIDLPDFIVVGRPEPKDIVIDIPAFTILGKPEPEELTVSLPAFVIFGKPEREEVIIDVPEFVVIGRPEDEDDERLEEGLAKTRTERQNPQPPEQGTAIQQDPAREVNDAVRGFRCHGSYTAHIGKGLATAQGLAMPVGQTMTRPAQVDAMDCGDSITVTIDGMRIPMKLDKETKVYSGSLPSQGDGANRGLSLSCDDDSHLRGHLVASDANLRIARPVWLMHDSEPVELQCK